MILMNELTKKVLELQETEKGSFEWDVLFGEIYTRVQPSMQIMVNSYAYSLRGDIAEGESVAMGHLVSTVETFSYVGYEFLTYYKKTLRNRLVDLVRHINTNKNKHNTCYEISLSVSIQDNEGSDFAADERMVDDSLITVDTYLLDSENITLAEVLESFRKDMPEHAALLEIIMMYSSANGYKKKDLGAAVAAFYGESDYSNKLQARVSRTIKSFKKYADNNGYVFNF